MSTPEILIKNDIEYTTSVSFVSNMPKLVIKCDVEDPEYRFVPHTGPCVQRGISFMYRQGGGCWRPLDSGLPRKTFNENMLAFTDEGSEYEILMYYSLFRNVKSISIEASEGYYLKTLERKKEHIFVVGGALSQGFGCATPGMAWSAILGRKTGREIYSIRTGAWLSGEETEEKIDKYRDVIETSECIIIEADALHGSVQRRLAAFGKPLILLIDTPEDEKTIRDACEAAGDAGADVLDMSYLYDEKTEDLYTINRGIPDDGVHIRIYEAMKKLMEKKVWNI